MKKIFLSLAAVVAIVAGVVGMSAFESHIINVTAHIENALSVATDPISFGTVFPQEYVERSFDINLSDSFNGADRVDDVEYVINQKLKPCPVHKGPCDPPAPGCDALVPDDPTCVADKEGETPENPTGWHYLSLCPFLSKTNNDPDGTAQENDVSHSSYFVPAVPDGAAAHCQDVTTVASGVLSKAAEDITDAWTVDLKVPPVTGNVAQDWPAGCPTVSDNDKSYGCDLWIEVTGVSLSTSPTPTPTPTPSPTPTVCADQADVMLVLDRSGSIDASELGTLKTASHAFVTALNPDGGVHMGQTSFSDTGTLDLHLTNNQTNINNAIDALVAGGFTNLSEGILLANGELADTNLPFERPAVPDYIVVITDGEPNRPTDEANGQAAAALAATAARAAGAQVFVLGIGVTPTTETYLKTQIADDASHYFAAANFTDLEALLQGIAECL